MTEASPLTLTADAFNQIIHSLKSDVGRRFNEKRQKPRVGVRGRIPIVTLEADGAGGESFEVWVRDISANGIGILHTQPLKPGRRFAACFYRHDDHPLTLTYVVAHAKAAVKGLYQIGGRLVSVDNDEDATGA